ncbi:MAG: NGG1p interacting factor NIF3 [Bacteriovoracia bacterium]
MFHIAFYVPSKEAEKVKEKMFQAGAGKLGNYDKCSFESRGIGQFRPLAGSTPFIGNEGTVEQVEELKVEMICKKEFLEDVIAALKESHPYETPAYYVTETVGI